MQSARSDFGKLAARILNTAPADESVVLAWPLACGSAVAKRTEAISFADGTLWIRVPDAGWKDQLEGFSARYCQKLSELSGVKVDRIRYEAIRTSLSAQRY